MCLRGRGNIWQLSKGLDVVERAARGLNLRDRRSTLETGHRFRGRRCIFCIWVCVCVAGATYGCCLERLDVVERAARGLNLHDRRSTFVQTHLHSFTLTTLTRAYRLPAQAY